MQHDSTWKKKNWFSCLINKEFVIVNPVFKVIYKGEGKKKKVFQVEIL